MGEGTTIGTIASLLRAEVDGHGTVSGGAWSVAWSVCAGDRWYDPQEEATVRQQLMGYEPLVETKMRIPGGDVVARAYAVVVSGIGDAAVIEVENQSPAPIAVAFRATRDAGREPHGPALLFPRTPTMDGDAAVLPLVHRGTLRVAMPFSPTQAAILGSLPTAEQVARAWKTQAGRGLRATLPAGNVADAFERERRRLLLTFAGDHLMTADLDVGPALIALDQLGFHREAADVLCAMPRSQRFDGSFGARPVRIDATAGIVRAAANHWRVTADREVLEVTLPAVALAARCLARARAHADALQDAGDLLDAAEEHKAAAQCRKAAGRAAAGDADPPRHPVSRVRDMLVDDRADLVLLGGIPDEWRGQPIEVHDAPTRYGLVSFAVRWHGDRPALLWEVAGSPPRISSPVIGPAWETDQPQGEEMVG